MTLLRALLAVVAVVAGILCGMAVGWVVGFLLLPDLDSDHALWVIAPFGLGGGFLAGLLLGRYRDHTLRKSAR